MTHTHPLKLDNVLRVSIGLVGFTYPLDDDFYLVSFGRKKFNYTACVNNLTRYLCPCKLNIGHFKYSLIHLQCFQTLIS